MAKFELTTQQEQVVINKVDRLFKVLEEQNNFRYEIALLCSDIVKNPNEWMESSILRAECEKRGIDLGDLGNLSTKKAIFEKIFEPLFDFTYSDFIIYSQVGEVVKRFNLSLNEFNEIGYTKLRFLASFSEKISDKEFLDLLEKTKGMTTRELQKYIALLEAKLSVKEEGEVPKKRGRPAKIKEEVEESEIERVGEEEDEKEEIFIRSEPEYKSEYKYLSVAFRKDVYEEIVAEALRIAEELTGYVDLERKLLYIFMDFIALHQTTEERIQQLKESVEQLMK